jgi:hypothetical protein
MGSLTEWTTLQAAFEELLALGPDISVHPLFARLVVASTEEQLKAFQPSTTEWIQIIQELKASVNKRVCFSCQQQHERQMHGMVTTAPLPNQHTTVQQCVFLHVGRLIVSVLNI